MNSDLTTLQDTDGTAGTDTIKVNAVDSFNNAATQQTVAVTVNDVPVIAIAAPATATIGVNQPDPIAGISLSESGNTTGETFTVTLSDTNGSYRRPGARGLGGNDTLTISGNLTQVNSDLSTLQDTDGTAGSDTIKVNAVDSFNNSATQQTVAVTVNDVPVIAIAAPATATIGVNQPDPIPGISLSESGNTTGETFTVTLSDTNGVLSATGGTWSSGNDTLTISGKLTQVNSDLSTLQDTDGTAGTDTIKVNAVDSFNNTATQQTVAVTVNNVPMITVPGAQTIGVGQAAAITGVSLSESGNTTGETFTVTLSDTNGVLSATGGTWSSGNDTLTISGNLTQVNSDLSTLQDTDGTAGTDTIKVNAVDSFHNNATQQTVAVTVNGTPPTGFIFTPDAATLGALEDGGVHLASGEQIGTFTGTGGDAGATYTFIIDGKSSGNFTVNGGNFSDSTGTNSKSLSTAGNISGSSGGTVYALSVKVSDSSGNVTLPFDVVVGGSGNG